MAGTFADNGATYVLGVVFSDTTKLNTLKVHLFKDDITPTDTSTSGSFTEATGGGYAAQTLDINASFIDSVSITSSSAANPTNILTATTHGLSTNDYVTIKNHSGSASNINGTHQVTVVDTTNFTIPVDLSSGGGTGGTLSRGVEITTESGIVQMASNPIPFYFTGALTSSATIYGYYLMANASEFIGAENFADTYTPTTAGDILNVTVLIKMSKGTAT